MTEPVHDSLQAAGLAPGEHAVDSGYVSADLLVSARQRGITLIGPLLADTSPQARSGGHTQEAFAIDWDREQVTCPQGTASKRWTPTRQRGGIDVIAVQFSAATCRACPPGTSALDFPFRNYRAASNSQSSAELRDLVRELKVVRALWACRTLGFARRSGRVSGRGCR